MEAHGTRLDPASPPATRRLVWNVRQCASRASRGVPSMSSSERLFNTMLYVLFVTPAAIAFGWAVWGLMVCCAFYTGLIADRVRRLPFLLQVPVAIALLLLCAPFFLLALFGWILIRIFPALGSEQGEVPRLFAPTRSRTVSHVFLAFLALLFFVVP